MLFCGSPICSWGFSLQFSCFYAVLVGGYEEVCVCVNWYPGPSNMTELWGSGFSKPQSLTSQSLDSVIYCYVLYPTLPGTIIPTVVTTLVHLPNWASPVSDPAYLTATRGHLPNWASSVSFPSCRIPNPPSLSTPGPTVWRSILRSSPS